jgi:hypothetical protein
MDTYKRKTQVRGMEEDSAEAGHEKWVEAEFDKWVEAELEKIPIIILPKDTQEVQIQQTEETNDFEEMKVKAKYLRQYPMIVFRPRTRMATPKTSPGQTVKDTPSKRQHTGDGSADSEPLKTAQQAWATLHRLVSIALRITC